MLSTYQKKSNLFTTFVAVLMALLLVFFVPATAHAENGQTESSTVRIHVLPFDHMDAIIVECDGHFGVVDSAEDSEAPDGSDFRYPVRPGTTYGQGKEDEVIAYMRKIGVTQDNLDFYIGTHPHSDHIGSASQIIHAFHPKTIYTPVYDDSYITDSSALWDNRFVYDRLIAAAEWAQKEYGARIIQHLDPSYTEPVDPDPDPDPDPVDPDPVDPDPVDPDPTDPDPVSTGRSSSLDDVPSAASRASVDDERSGSLSPSEEANEGTKKDDERPGSLSPSADEQASSAQSDVSSAAPSTDAQASAASAQVSKAPAESAAVAPKSKAITTAEDPTPTEDPRKGSPVFKLGSATIEILNYDESYQTTKVPDANYFSYGVKVTAANGRSAFLSGDINNLVAPGERMGDEDALKAKIGKVDLLKLGHHGRVNSNSVDYLRTILKDANGEDRAVVVQTGPFSLMPNETIEAFQEKGARHYQASLFAKWGKGAFVAELASSGVKVNAQGDETIVIQEHNEAPCARAYRDGLPYKLTGWQEVASGTKYYFGEPGTEGSTTPLTNCFVEVDGKKVYIGSNGTVSTGWQQDGSTWYYIGEDAEYLTGWQKIGDKTYFFNEDGAMATGWKVEGSKRYYLDAKNGDMKTGWQKIDGKLYCFDSKGALTSGKTGWVQVEHVWYYATSTSGDYKTGWLKSGGKWYYLKEDGAMATGFTQVDNVWYYLNGSGAMKTGWQKISGVWYHFKGSGAMSIGWLKTGGKWYYLKENGAMATGFIQVNNVWYYLNGSGAMKTGWQKVSGTWYHFKGSGAMSIGWLKTGGKWYYLQDNGAMATGFTLVDNVWYYLNGSGAMKTGWQKISGYWYYFKGSGAMTTGWQKVKGKWYYLQDNGVMVTGNHTIDGVAYRFSSSGALL